MMLKPAIKLILILLWILICLPLVWFARAIRKPVLRDYFMQRCCRGVMKFAGITLSIHGALSDKRPLLVVSNHISYLDIVLLGSHNNFRYTPKSEIAKWPLIGFLCKIADCVFVDRRPGKVKEVSRQIRDVLDKGEVVSIFPEATTGGGIHMLPFKSSFFNLAEEDYTGRKLYIQPVALTYTKVSSLPMDLRLWHKVAWVGDMELAPHLWEFLSLPPVKAELHFLPPVTIESFEGRKELAAHCHRVIEEKINSIRVQSYVAVRPQKASTVFSLLRSKSK